MIVLISTTNEQTPRPGGRRRSAQPRTRIRVRVRAQKKRRNGRATSLFYSNSTMAVAFTVSAPVAVRRIGEKAGSCCGSPPLLASHTAPPRLCASVAAASKAAPASAGAHSSPGGAQGQLLTRLSAHSPVRVMPRRAAEGLRCRPHRHRHRARVLPGLGAGAPRKEPLALANRNAGRPASLLASLLPRRAGRAAGSRQPGGRLPGVAGERQADQHKDTT